jgi:chromosome segregation ATPase
MRNFVDTAARRIRSWIERRQRRSQSVIGAAPTDLAPATPAVDPRFENKVEELHAVLTLRVHDLYAETWRLRDAVDARLGALEQRLEESASRYETSMLEVEASANQVKETCRNLADTLDRQYATAETAVESLREAHDRRLRHLEQSHRAELAALEREHDAALRARADARRNLAERIQALAETASLEISNVIELNSNGTETLTPIERLMEKLQPRRRVRQLEEALLRFEREVAELARTASVESDPADRDVLIGTSLESALPPSAGRNGNGHGNGNGNGNGHSHELHFGVRGLARS